MRSSLKSGDNTTSSRPPCPLAQTCGTPLIGSDSLPSLLTTRRCPGRSVTSMRPSPMNARPQGFCIPLATSSVETLDVCACADAANSVPATASTVREVALDGRVGFIRKVVEKWNSPIGARAPRRVPLRVSFSAHRPYTQQPGVQPYDGERVQRKPAHNGNGIVDGTPLHLRRGTQQPGGGPALERFAGAGAGMSAVRFSRRHGLLLLALGLVGKRERWFARGDGAEKAWVEDGRRVQRQRRKKKEELVEPKCQHPRHR